MSAQAVEAAVHAIVRFVWCECELQNVEGLVYVTCPIPVGVNETCTWALASTAFAAWLSERMPAPLEILQKARGEVERQALEQLPPVPSDRLPWTP